MQKIILARKPDTINVDAVIALVSEGELLLVLEASALVDHLSEEHGELATRDAVGRFLECPADRRRWSRVAASDHRLLQLCIRYGWHVAGCGRQANTF